MDRRRRQGRHDDHHRCRRVRRGRPQAVADNLHDAKLAAAVADVAAVRRADAAGRVERLRVELTAAEALLASYTPGSPADHVGGRTAG